MSAGVEVPSTFTLTTALLIFQVFVIDYLTFLPQSLLPLSSFFHSWGGNGNNS
jgi:hypothetical protein